MMFKFLLFSVLCASSVFATDIYYDEDGRPDYEKINESMEQERKERERQHIV